LALIRIFMVLFRFRRAWCAFLKVDSYGSRPWFDSTLIILVGGVSVQFTSV
jgi:hypothetical protein